jgi:hypothetical protein
MYKQKTKNFSEYFFSPSGVNTPPKQLAVPTSRFGQFFSIGGLKTLQNPKNA